MDEDFDEVDDRTVDMRLMKYDDVSIEFFAYCGRFSDVDLSSGELSGQSVAPAARFPVLAGDIIILEPFTLYRAPL